MNPLILDGWEVYQWPEFEAFAKRLGIDCNAKTLEITITLIQGKRPIVDQKYVGVDNREYL